MKEQLISFKTAKLAKEKGFNWLTMFHYTGTGKLDSIGYDTNENSYKNTNAVNAPTQSLLQRWIREEKNIDVNCYAIKHNNSRLYKSEIFNGVIEPIMEIVYRKTYEQALEAGLHEALKLLS